MPQFKAALFISQQSISKNTKPFSDLVYDLWSQASDEIDNLPTNLEITSINLNFEAYISDAWQFLSVTEKNRANKFTDKNNMAAFILAHASLRLLLGQEHEIRPLDINFLIGQHGKPSLKFGAISTPFNISYSKDAFAIVIGSSDVGIDIETLRNDFDLYGIAKKMFTSNEIGKLNRFVSDAETLINFFEIWTRKEAVIKLFGAKLEDMPYFSLPNEKNSIIDYPWTNKRCYSYPLEVKRNYALAVAFCI